MNESVKNVSQSLMGPRDSIGSVRLGKNAGVSSSIRAKAMHMAMQSSKGFGSAVNSMNSMSHSPHNASLKMPFSKL
jgi:hypothetical protein